MATETTPEMQAALDAFHSAKTRDEERVAYARMRALGFPPAYGEDAPAPECGLQPMTAIMSDDLAREARLPELLRQHADYMESYHWSFIGSQFAIALALNDAAKAIEQLRARVAELKREQEEGGAHEP